MSWISFKGFRVEGQKVLDGCFQLDLGLFWLGHEVWEGCSCLQKGRGEVGGAEGGGGGGEVREM